MCLQGQNLCTYVRIKFYSHALTKHTWQRVYFARLASGDCNSRRLWLIEYEGERYMCVRAECLSKMIVKMLDFSTTLCATLGHAMYVRTYGRIGRLQRVTHTCTHLRTHTHTKSLTHSTGFPKIPFKNWMWRSFNKEDGLGWWSTSRASSRSWWGESERAVPIHSWAGHCITESH